MPEMELMQHTPDELAHLCGCTARHFSRLFRRHFGKPPRARQTELRLLNASQLLAETESKIIRRVLPSLRTNTILNGLVFQQELDRANRNRDRQIYPVINPGPEPGTTELDLRVKDRLPLHGRIELDNYSTPETPELRLNTGVQYNNLWQLEHQLGVQYSFSPEDYKQGSFPFYDLPLIASYSAFYRLPLSAVNGVSHNQEYQLSEFGYDEVTHRFRPPPVGEASELLFYASRSSVDTSRRLQSETLTPPTVPPEGTLQVLDQVFSRALTVNENLGARWSVPLPEVFAVRSSFSLGPDFKNFREATGQDRTFQATVYVPEVGQTGPPFTSFPSPPTFSSRSLFNSVVYLPVTLLWAGDKRDKWGATGFTLNQSFNYGGLLGSEDDFRALAGPKANGNYYILTASLEREQKLPGDWGLRLHADGQWANQPLISNEQFALGGLAGVRGYRDGEEYGDTGWRVQVEPHTPYLTVGVLNGKLPITARLYTFIDYGERYLLDPVGRRATVPMLGLGGGLESNIGSHVEFRLAIGVPALDVPTRNSGDARASFALSAQF
jgi:AraC-like DNA-binding protein